MIENINKYHIYLIYILLVIITFIVFEPILHNGFISFDDDVYIYKNDNITTGPTLKNIIWAFTDIHANNYHPLTSISHMIDCRLYKLNPAGHHFTNLLFHIANTLLLFMVLSRMTKKIWASAFVAILFAIHPVHVESVAWASERKDVLSIFFWMLTMWAYARYCYYVAVPATAKQTPTTGVGAKHYYLLTIVFFILGLLSKPMLVTLPFVLLLLDYWPLDRFRNTRFGRLVVEKIPFFILSAISSIITFYVQQKMGIVKTLTNYPLSWRIENALVSYIIYIRQMFWPFDLAIFYPHPKGSTPFWQITGAVLILVLITLPALTKLRRYPYFAVGWFWFLGTLAPVIGIFQVGLQGHADRYTYVPYIGLFIAIVWGASELLAQVRYRKWIFGLFAAVLLSFLGIKTYIQNLYWNNNIFLYKHAINVVENVWWAHHFLGNVFTSTGEYEEALKEYREALKIDPENATIYHAMAKTYLDKGDVNEAIQLYQKLLPPLPDDLNEPRRVDITRFDYSILKDLYVNANINLAEALTRQGNFAEAAKRFKEALRVAPDAETARKGLEDIQRRTKDNSLLP